MLPCAMVYKISTYIGLLAFSPCLLLYYFIKDFFCWTGLRQVGMILVQTGYCHLCSLKRHHLLVHQHSFKYEENIQI